MMSRTKTLIMLALAASPIQAAKMQDTLPPLENAAVPKTFEALWKGFDPQKEPLDVEVLKAWEEDGVVMKVIRYRVAIFNGKKAMMALQSTNEKDDSVSLAC